MPKVLVHTYPHRLDAEGKPITKIIIVASTATPPVSRGPVKEIVTRINQLKNLRL